MEQVQDATVVGGVLLELLTTQKRYYVELQRMAEQQRALIQAGRPEQLLKLLSKRQRIITSISKLHEKLAPYRAEWDQVKQQLSDSCRGEIQTLLAELESTLGEILAHDQQDCQQLSSHTQKVGGELATAIKGQAANRAYKPDSAAKQASRPSGTSFEVSG